MKLTNQQIHTLSVAIQALDGRHETQIVEGKAVAIFKNVRLAHAARWALARNHGRIQTALEDFNRAQSSLIAHHTGGEGSISATHPRFNDFATDRHALLEQPVELDLDQITLADLKLEENETTGNGLPISVLSALQPLIKL